MHVISANVMTYKGEIGDNLRAVLYSMEFQPDKDKPVSLSQDVEEFLTRHGGAQRFGMKGVRAAYSFR